MSKVIKYGSVREENRAAATEFVRTIFNLDRRYFAEDDSARILPDDMESRLLDAIESYEQGRAIEETLADQTADARNLEEIISSAEHLIDLMKKTKTGWGETGRPNPTEWMPESDQEIDFIRINVIRRARWLLNSFATRPSNRMEKYGMTGFIWHIYRAYEFICRSRTGQGYVGRPFLRFCNDWLDACTIDGKAIPDRVRLDKADAVEDRFRRERLEIGET